MQNACALTLAPTMVPWGGARTGTPAGPDSWPGGTEMGKALGGGGLVLLAFLMLSGFLRSHVNPWAPATLIALLVAVVLPLGVGIFLLAGVLGAGSKIDRRREELRHQTLQAEILRLAACHGGKLTVVEVTTELAIDPKSAEEALDALAVRESAEVELTESGIMVYAFRGLEHLKEEKARSKRILDA
ncbi:MAG: hypothetical protein HY692_01400 [Cyanobacteria bacterium NC_groundwater_1444_Ag_S-0.65um_54_12]|nr:hypothetical protein [Cyanobacteria bacterium NC_groundwater_1444_Ag_S-0.65um_54_12]